VNDSTVYVIGELDQLLFLEGRKKISKTSTQLM